VSTEPAFPNPLDWSTRPETAWSRVNIAEATPGVVVPLHFDFSVRAGERGTRWGLHDRGVIEDWELAEPPDASDRVMACFRGRLAINVDVMRKFFDRIPGTSGDDIEYSLLGAVRPDAPDFHTEARYSEIAIREPRVRAQADALAAAHALEIEEWWRACVSPPLLHDIDRARDRWIRACGELETGTRQIAWATHFAGGAFARVAGVCAAIGRPELAAAVNGGYGDTHDDATSAALWALSRGECSMAQFLGEFGYQGNRASYLAAPVWREDPSQLVPVLAALAELDEDCGPTETARARARAREVAERELLSLVPADERDDVERALADLHRFTVMRELVKATSQRALDVGRAASRVLGHDFVAQGILEAPDDVFHLVGDEFVTGQVPDLAARVAYRRALAAEYALDDMPVTFVGTPEAVPIAHDRPVPVDVLTGMGVSPGMVEGIVRVIIDPARAEPLHPGEILVCETTDPSWVGHFLVAGALVIDVGGPMSHGAIVARELGVPCVVNTQTGTRQLRTGDRVMVDADRGVVEVLGRA
jgi:pyruvate,water dikinase